LEVPDPHITADPLVCFVVFSLIETVACTFVRYVEVVNIIALGLIMGIVGNDIFLNTVEQIHQFVHPRAKRYHQLRILSTDPSGKGPTIARFVSGIEELYISNNVKVESGHKLPRFPFEREYVIQDIVEEFR
jgi:hypothetical protein